MDNESEFALKLALIIFTSLIILMSIIIYGIYVYHALEVKNFQTTIKDLSDEQKCLHICGFEFDGYLESYKFCAEKCDRISERLHEGD